MNRILIAGTALACLLLTGCGPDTKIKWRTLYTAVQKGDVQDVEKHLLLGEKINEKNSTYGWTPLHKAVAMDNKEIVKVLLDHGARTDLKDQWGQTPLELATKLGHSEVADMIRKKS